MLRQQLISSLFFLLISSYLTSASAFTAIVPSSSVFVGTTATRRAAATTTVEPETIRETERKQQRQQRKYDSGMDEDDFDDTDYPDLEYLIDSAQSREMNDPFHILLLGSTFEKPKMTLPYVAGSLTYVLDMPQQEASELSKFAADQGVSCLGTWPREECLDLGKQLQRRDLECRVVPFCPGGQRGWQAKDGSAANNGEKKSYSAN